MAPRKKYLSKSFGTELQLRRRRQPLAPPPSGEYLQAQQRRLRQTTTRNLHLKFLSCRHVIFTLPTFVCLLSISILFAQQQQSQSGAPGEPSDLAQRQFASPKVSAIPAPQARPNVRVNVREWARRVSDDVRLVSNRTSCASRIGTFYERAGEFEQFDPVRARDTILSQINSLLSQHKAAVNGIVMEAEKAAMAHQFVKNLRVNYTDVHRTRNELEPLPTAASIGGGGGGNLYGIDPQNDYTTNQYGDRVGAGSSGDRPSITSISGGTPVPGPPEWQTPIKSIVMQMNRNFGDIPVNISMSAVHLPLPIYPGLPEIMNGIAWTEKLDSVFRRNLVQFMHVHHQYYGDTLGFLRTFPAHKWRIARNEPDLFDARTRPWYIAGAATPKDVVILVDTSGSMTGLRREIARGVVFEILDTLTINDHFVVMRFSETVTPVGLPACALKRPRLVPELDGLCPVNPGSVLASASADTGPIRNQAHASAHLAGQFSSSARTLMDHTHHLHQHTTAAATSGHFPGATSGANHLLNTNQHQAAAAAGANLNADQRRALAFECAEWKRQWEARRAYLTEHANSELGKNGTIYLSDDAYRQSIQNVSLDIRDAFLLPATSRNIRYLKSNFSMPTAGIANFTRALMAGFELLQAYNRSQDQGSQCNQAIMLITDGAIKSHLDVFNRYNYPNAPVRVFTYMIGREVGDIRPTKEMACRNRGYYAHVINLGEVREQVQKYLPVMARPLVLAHAHPIVWTNAYGDETYQVLTDWVLEVKRRERARIMLNEERERLNEANSSDVITLEMTSLPEYDELPQVDETLKNRIICEDARDDQEAMDASLGEEIDPLGYNDLACHWSTRRADLLMSVVKPVFDLRNTSLIFERYLSKNIWQEKEIHLKNARLLGVAAVDLRIDDIVRAAPSHLLGPNGYAILIGQNGFIMHHPEYRALLEDPFDKQSKILKPYFSAVDLTHVEQIYHKSTESTTATTTTTGASEQATTTTGRKRDDDMKLVKLREAAVKRASGSESMYVKRTIDCRKRPHVRLQTFYYGPIKDTPYSFMLALPASYGLNRMQAKLALDKNSYSYLKPTDYDLWTVHPEYRYCELNSAQNHLQQLYLNDSLNTLISLLNMTSEGKLYEFEYDDLSAISGSSINQAQEGQQQQQQQQYQNAAASARQKYFQTNVASSQSTGDTVPHFTCDKELFPSLLFDAKATYDSFVSTLPGNSHPRSRSSDDDDEGHCTQTSEEMRTKFSQIYGLEMSFVATRSGLTRARIFSDTPRIKKLAKLFIERHDRAVDESWYSRTVDWNLRFSDDSTIITVAYNAYIRLIAKLRQRITQRHPAVNDTRSNCDPSLVDDTTDEFVAGGDPNAGDPQAAGQQQQEGAGLLPAGGLALTAGTPLGTTASEQAQNDDPQVPSQGKVSPGDGTQQQDDQAAAAAAQDGENSTSGAQVDGINLLEGGEQVQQAPRINYSEYSSFDFLDLLANSSVHVTATQTIVVNKAKRQHRTPVGVTGHLYDYAIFARKFLNGTSLDIRTYPVGSAGNSFHSGGNDNFNNINPQAPPPPLIKVDICPGGECPTKCGFRNDTIDCLLVDNNGFIVVGEELPHIGRSLIDYDENLMQSLVDKRVFHQIQMVDYQAICARNDQMTSEQQKVAAAAASGAMGSVPGGNITAMLLATTSASQASSSSSSSSSLGCISSSPLSGIAKLSLAQSALANFAAALVWTVTTLYSALLLQSSLPNNPEHLFGSESLIGRLHQWQRSALMLADAQSAIANQSLLALLPNKTYLRPCEKMLTLYETRPYDSSKLYSDSPEYYETKCGCSGWYVYDAVPKTNLLVLIVNTTSSCRRCETSSSTSAGQPLNYNNNPQAAIITPLVNEHQQRTGPAGATSSSSPSRPEPQQEQQIRNPSPEEQVCSMLERDQPLYVQRPGSCMEQHPDEAQIHICGGASKILFNYHLYLTSVISLFLLALRLNRATKFNVYT